MTEDILQGILDSRTPEATESDPVRRTETWLLAEGIATLDEMKALMPYINAGGSVYRTKVVGYFDRDGPGGTAGNRNRRYNRRARIVFWRDMSHFGPGYASELLGVETRDASN